MTRRAPNITGMCASTGTAISGAEHVRQSIARIVTTLIGSRIQRRDFGADIMPLIAAPGNEATRLKITAVIARAILRWEIRIQLSHILFTIDFNGKSKVDIYYSYNGEAINQRLNVFGGAS